MDLSFPLLTSLLLAAFLATLGGLALVVTRAAAPAPGGSGGSSRGCFGGCAAALALVFLCGLGVVGLGGFLVVTCVGSAVELNPIEKIEIRRSGATTGAPETSSGLVPERILGGPGALEHGDGPVHALFTVRGDAGAELVELMRELAGIDAHELEEFLSVHRAGAGSGELDVYEFRLPLTESDLAELEREIERELDGLKLRLPEKIEIHFEGAERFY